MTKPNLSESKSNSDFQTEKTRDAIVRSRARWYEHGEKNSKYFLNLEQLNYRRKHISSLINHNGTRINDPKEILNEEWNFFKELYSSRNVDPNLIPKKKKDTQYLKKWRPVSLLNVDYKIATKTIALL